LVGAVGSNSPLDPVRNGTGDSIGYSGELFFTRTGYPERQPSTLHKLTDINCITGERLATDVLAIGARSAVS